MSESRTRLRSLLVKANSGPTQGVWVARYRDYWWNGPWTDFLGSNYYTVPLYQDAGARLSERIVDYARGYGKDNYVYHAKWKSYQWAKTGQYTLEEGTYGGIRYYSVITWNIPGFSTLYTLPDAAPTHAEDPAVFDGMVRSIIDDATQLWKPKTNLIVSLLELKDISKVARHIKDAPLFARRAYEGWARKRRKTLGTFVDFASQSWLTWIFGIVPVLNDFKELSRLNKEMARRINVLIKRIRQQEQSKPTTLSRKWTVTKSEVIYGRTYEVTTTHTLSARCHIRMSLPLTGYHSQAIAKSYGLFSILSGVYALIPFSFVGDWFFPSTKRKIADFDLTVEKHLGALLGFKDIIFTDKQEVLSASNWNYSRKTVAKGYYTHDINYGPGLTEQARFNVVGTVYERVQPDMSKWSEHIPFGTLPGGGQAFTLGTLSWVLIRK